MPLWPRRGCGGRGDANPDGPAVFRWIGTTLGIMTKDQLTGADGTAAVTQPAAAAQLTRTETDSMGPVEVPAAHYWGAQTARSLQHFPIGGQRYTWGGPLIHAFGLLKGAAARSNAELGVLDPQLATLITAAASEVAEGVLDAEFPLKVFQTGSGTQTNMNANEVIAARANEIATGQRGGKSPVHPNDHVNKGQSSNDVFPTAMYVAVARQAHRHLIPAVESLAVTFRDRASRFADVVMVGRTHLQDATPIRWDQVVGSWAAQLEGALAGVRAAARGLYRVALGGTAVGTGLNSHPRFAARVCELLEEATGLPFHPADDLPAALAAHDDLVTFSASLRTLAAAAMKIANDIRWYASGPRTGIGEIAIPDNEPGSSIMPGKVNPTQAEALTQVCVAVFGYDAAVAFAGSQGNFQLNVYKPVMVFSVLEALLLLGDALRTFERFCAAGITPREAVISAHLDRNLMLVTALAPHIGYDAAAKLARAAQASGASLREVALASGQLSAADFDTWVNPAAMTEPEAS